MISKKRKSEVTKLGWENRRQRYGPSGRSYFKRGKIHRQRKGIQEIILVHENNKPKNSY